MSDQDHLYNYVFSTRRSSCTCGWASKKRTKSPRRALAAHRTHVRHALRREEAAR